MTGEVISVNISEAKGTTKHAVPLIRVGETGIADDAHAGRWSRQISLLDIGQIERFARECGRSFQPGEFAENITTKGIVSSEVAVHDRFRIGTVELAVTQIGKKCHGGDCAVFRAVGKCVMPAEGIFARVITGGEIKSGDRIEHYPRSIAIRILTLSDRASAGEYADTSGPTIADMLREHFGARSSRLDIARQVLPDDAALLGDAISAALREKTDIIITTGGTGIGPRDITADVVRAALDKEIPGIMEAIRIKYGQANPSALLSRSVAGVTREGALIYALPGSLKAVKEYMSEILATLEHALLMAWGGNHG